MLIVGGGPGWQFRSHLCTARGVRTGIVAERFGGQVMDTLGIENFYFRSKETEGPQIGAALEQHVKAYDVDVMDLQKVVRLAGAANTGMV